MSGRETLGSVPGGPRVSRGQVGRLGDHVASGPFALLAVAQLGFLGVFVCAAQGLAPALRAWVWGAAADSLAATAGGWGMARWLVRQPVAAADATELRWSVAVRAQDVSALLLLGPAWAMLVGGVAFVDASGPVRAGVYPLALYVWAYLGVFLLATVAVAAGTRRSTRDGVQGVADARR